MSHLPRPKPFAMSKAGLWLILFLVSLALNLILARAVLDRDRRLAGQYLQFLELKLAYLAKQTRDTQVFARLGLVDPDQAAATAARYQAELDAARETYEALKAQFQPP